MSSDRYNIPELAKTHTVYAMDLLGFGLSEKALIEYNANVWRDQVGDFLKEVVGKPAVLAGNRYLFFYNFFPSMHECSSNFLIILIIP